ncbi:MAG: hypothetical protein VKI42_03065 [Synechococcaceae cyanobacterium]|nr:hypothetical protein [Synechococcaceae cyanobacterium]
MAFDHSWAGGAHLAALRRLMAARDEGRPDDPEAWEAAMILAVAFDSWKETNPIHQP